MTRVEDLKHWSTYFSQPFLVHSFKGANGRSMKDATGMLIFERLKTV